MDNSIYGIFGMEQAAGEAILVEALLYANDHFKCPDCGIIHEMKATAVIDLLKAYPGTPEEREFLFFMFGGMVQSASLWVQISVSIREVDKFHPRFNSELRLKFMTQWINTCLFSSH